MRAQVEASSPVAQAALEELLATAISYGADVHPGLWLREQDGEMSVHADVPDGETLIRLPEELLVPMDGARWDVADGGLSIVSHSEGATDAQRDLADALVGVYKATRKAAWAVVGLPKVALIDVPDALAAIRTLRPGFALQRVSTADALVQTRVLRWSVGSAPEDDNGGRFLLPVIDLINHHRRGAPWGRVENALNIAVARPAGDSQCFVRYRARQDPLDLALDYGFVDSSCTLARSVPVTVDVAGLGWIEVAGQHLHTRSALDPPAVAIEPDRLWLSHVTFDARHPERLAGVLQLAVSALIARKPGPPGAANTVNLTATLIDALIERNLTVLQVARTELVGLGDSLALETVALAVEEQQRVLERFQEFLTGITQV